MSLIADACNLMLDQAYTTALNKLYSLNCSTGDLGTTILHHFKLFNCSVTGDESCCIQDYLNSYVITEEDCTTTFTCANANIVQVVPLEEAIIISQS